MSKDSSQFLTFATEKEKNSSVNLKSLFAKYVYKWPVIVVTTITMLMIGFLYLQIAEPVYQVKATLLVNTDNANDKPKENQSVLDKIDLPNNSDVVENEIAKLKSAKLINQVINDLQLSVSYQQKDGLFYKDLYAQVPFKFVLVKLNQEYGKKIQIKVIDSKTFSLYTENGDKQYAFSDIMHTSIGTWKLIPTGNLLLFKDATIKLTLLDPDKLTDYYQKNIDASLEDKLAT